MAQKKEVNHSLSHVMLDIIMSDIYTYQDLFEYILSILFFNIIIFVNTNSINTVYLIHKSFSEKKHTFLYINLIYRIAFTPFQFPTMTLCSVVNLIIV